MKKRMICGFIVFLLGVLLFQQPVLGLDIGDTDRSFVKVYFEKELAAYRALDLFEAQSIEMSFEDKYIVMFVTEQEKQELLSYNYKVADYPDFDLYHTRTDIPNQIEGIPGYPCYTTVEEAFAKVDSFAPLYPKILEVIDIGDSWEKTQGSGGYDLRLLKITNSEIKGDKPKLFIHGSLHAREYSTVGVVFDFSRYVLENYGKDADITWMVDYHELHTLIYANPDGRKHAEQGKMWRKNTNTNYCASDQSKRGCDLNRNFDYNWQKGTDECGETFSGASAASEPEVKAIQDHLNLLFTDDPKKGIYLDFHCYSEVFDYDKKWASLARKFSFFNGYGTKYNRSQSRGTSNDYGANVIGVASFCVELGTAFFQKCEDFDNKVYPDNAKMAKYAFRACRDPLELPMGPDATGLSIKGGKLSATVCDTNYGKGSEPSQNISAAEYYIKTPPWEKDAKPIALTASDGKFDSKVEKVEGAIDMSNWPGGKQIIYVRGKDADGKWGPVSGIFHDVTGIEPKISQVFILQNDMLTITQKNPSSVVFSIRCGVQTDVSLSVYTIDGKSIATVINKKLPVGIQNFSWPQTGKAAGKVASGMYLYKLSHGNTSTMGKFLFK